MEKSFPMRGLGEATGLAQEYQVDMADSQRKTHKPGSPMGKIGNRPYWVLTLSIVIRAIHQIGAAVFLAAFLLPEVLEVPSLYLMLATGSGVVLLATEGMRHRQIFREISGAGTFIKLILLGAAYHGLLPVVPTVLLVFFLSSICSHAPKAVRHRLLF